MPTRSTVTSRRRGRGWTRHCGAVNGHYDVGITKDPDQRISLAVLDYSIRGLYAELSNIEQLRDEIARGTPQDPVTRVKRPKGQIAAGCDGQEGDFGALTDAERPLARRNHFTGADEGHFHD